MNTQTPSMSRTIVHREVRTLNHDIEKIWAIVSDFGGVTKWMLSVSSCTVDGEGIGSVRTVTESGNSFQERLVVWDAPTHHISYRILDPTPFPATGLHGTIRLEEEAEGRTQITWTADAEVIDEQGLAIVGPVMATVIKTSLASLEKALQS